MKIHKIKYLRKLKFYIDSNSKTSRFAKLSTCKKGSNLQFTKLSPSKIKVFYGSNYCPFIPPYTIPVQSRQTHLFVMFLVLNICSVFRYLSCLSIFYTCILHGHLSELFQTCAVLQVFNSLHLLCLLFVQKCFCRVSKPYFVHSIHYTLKTGFSIGSTTSVSTYSLDILCTNIVFLDPVFQALASCPLCP